MIKIKVNQIKMNVKHSIDDVVKEALKKVHTQKNNLEEGHDQRRL